VLFFRTRNIENDPIYKVLSNPKTVTGLRATRTNVTVGSSGAAVSSFDAIVISRVGGNVSLPVRNVPLNAVLAELRTICPGAALL
jgi:hypothetical protein